MSYKFWRALVLAMMCVSCVAEYAAAGASVTTYRTGLDGGAARLIVYRLPTTGKFVFVDVYVDDVPVGAIAYGGRNYEAFLRPGHHALSALATPRPKWWERPPTMVTMRGGQTYRFTAVPNGQGNLVLRPMD